MTAASVSFDYFYGISRETQRTSVKLKNPVGQVTFFSPSHHGPGLSSETRIIWRAAEHSSTSSKQRCSIDRDEQENIKTNNFEQVVLPALSVCLLHPPEGGGGTWLFCTSTLQAWWREWVDRIRRHVSPFWAGQHWIHFGGVCTMMSVIICFKQDPRQYIQMYD